LEFQEATLPWTQANCDQILGSPFPERPRQYTSSSYLGRIPELRNWLATIAALLWNAAPNDGSELLTICVYFVTGALMLWYIICRLRAPQERHDQRSTSSMPAQQVGIPEVDTRGAGRSTCNNVNPSQEREKRGPALTPQAPRTTSHSTLPEIPSRGGSVQSLSPNKMPEPNAAGRISDRSFGLRTSLNARETTAQSLSNISTTARYGDSSEGAPSKGLESLSKPFWLITTASRAESKSPSPVPCSLVHDTQSESSWSNNTASSGEFEFPPAVPCPPVHEVCWSNVSWSNKTASRDETEFLRTPPAPSTPVQDTESESSWSNGEIADPWYCISH